jgi:hypothetical protein
VISRAKRYRARSIGAGFTSLLAVLGTAGAIVSAPEQAGAQESNWGSQAVVTGGNTFTCSSPTTCLTLDHSILTTSDGGATWVSHPTPAPKQCGTAGCASYGAVTCPSASTCYAAGGAPGELFITTTGGADWNQVQGNFPAFTAIACTSVTTCFAVGGGIYVPVMTTHPWISRPGGTRRGLNRDSRRVLRGSRTRVGRPL